MVQVSKITSLEHDLWSRALSEASRCYNRKITTLKRKHGYVQTKNNQLKEEINHLKDDKSILEELLKTQEESHKAEFERLRQSYDETFRKYQEDTQKNLIKMLLEWRSNMIIHAQVASDPLDLSKVYFDYLKDISMELLNFDICHPEDDE
ncbi:hypothetical protein PVK06_004591 [Gossypium arboreum]|uniref:Uncharacterized protein n=1 Tax=Gossypium arboreum TaxID=29729 RepID=A0ABR0QSN2_GOSAR|nr:hypothetical protein PVK06_004591 [Gossypium arboreum]